MNHYLLIYDFVADYVERRAAFRDTHLNLAWASAAKGDLILGGALADPVDTGLLLFYGEDSRAAEAFARSDPYVLNGLVISWRVRKWTTVAGENAAHPVRPSQL